MEVPRAVVRRDYTAPSKALDLTNNAISPAISSEIDMPPSSPSYRISSCNSSSRRSSSYGRPHIELSTSTATTTKSFHNHLMVSTHEPLLKQSLPNYLSGQREFNE